MNEPRILVVGAADTGRAPMAAALLRRLLRRHELVATVESAGVVGHDGEHAEAEARDAMLAMGLDLAAHVARSLNDTLVAEATLLLAVDAGVARVLRARYPAAEVSTLGGLAGRPRDIPDPFRMQIGAWLHYAGEIEALLRAGLPRLQALLGEPAAPAPQEPAAVVREPVAAPAPAAARVAAVERVARLLALLAELPEVVEWGSARTQLVADLAVIEPPLAPGDLSRPYVALIRAALTLATERPNPAEAAAMRGAVARLRTTIGPAELDGLASELPSFGGSV